MSSAYGQRSCKNPICHAAGMGNHEEIIIGYQVPSQGFNWFALLPVCLSCARRYLGFITQLPTNWEGPMRVAALVLNQNTCQPAWPQYRLKVASLLWRMTTRNNWQIESPSKERDWRVHEGHECSSMSASKRNTQNIKCSKHCFVTLPKKPFSPPDPYISSKWDPRILRRHTITGKLDLIARSWNPKFAWGFLLKGREKTSPRRRSGYTYIYILYTIYYLYKYG